MSASNCPETPRQKMIQMMYLVYTAMLALNVSAEVINGFVTVGDAMTMSNVSISEKLQDSYATFDAFNSNNPDKAREQWTKAQEVKKLSKEMKEYIDSVQFGFLCFIQSEVNIAEHVKTADGKVSKTKFVTPLRTPESTGADDEKNWLIDSARHAIYSHGYSCIKKPDDNNEGTRFFFAGTEANPSPDCRAMKLKNRIIDFKKRLSEIVDDSTLSLALNVEGEFFSEHAKDFVTWEQMNFNNTISIADMVVLNRIKSEVMTAEYDAVKILYSKVSADDFKFDKVAVLARPTMGAYVIQGGKYETKIGIGAYDSRATFDAEVNGQRLTSDETGMVTYSTVCNTPGDKKLHIKVYVKNDNGPAEAYEFEDNYFVAEPVAVISLTDMRVVYAGIDNPAEISVPGVAARDVVASVAEGPATITQVSPGKYNIKTTKPGKIKIRVQAKTDGKTLKDMGTQEFRSKSIPTPVLRISNRKVGESVSKSEILAVPTLKANCEGMEHLGNLRIQSFEMSFSGAPMPLPGKGNKFSDEMISKINKLNKGQKIYIENVKVKAPDGKIVTIEGSLRVK